MKRYFLIEMALLVCACVSSNMAVAADEELLGIVAHKLGSSSDPRVAPYLDPSSVIDSPMPNSQNLKKLSAFGVTFSGRAKLAGDEFNSLSYWSDESKLKSSVAEATFNAIASQLQQRHGPAKAADVPNYEDASTSIAHVLRWHMADEVILLYVHVRSPYASLGLVRIKQAAWLADMGAGGSEFWQVTLRRDAEHSQIENPETQSSVHNQPLASPSVPMSPTSIATPPASPSPIISIADAPAVPVERGALVSWVVGILALSVIATLIWRRRR